MQELSPNGRPSNLTIGQHAVVRSAEFKRWFGFWDLVPYGKAHSYETSQYVIEVAHGIKNGDASAIKSAAEFLSKQVTSEDLLISMPGRTGCPSHAHLLAKAIASIVGAEVFEDFCGNDRPSIYEAKKEMVDPDIDFGFHLESPLPLGKKTWIVDNVIGTGASMSAALKIIPDADPLVFAVDERNVSKVVDENYEPLVVYHGTTRDFEEFVSSSPFSSIKPRTTGGKSFTKKWVFFFTNDKEVASNYAKDISIGQKGGGSVIPVFLYLPKLEIIDAAGRLWKEFTELIKSEYIKGDFSGVLVKNTEDNLTDEIRRISDIYAVFDKDEKHFKIKSAIGNKEFDRKNPHILFENGALFSEEKVNMQTQETNNAFEGGVTSGPPHEKGGMPAIIITNSGNKPVNIRGGEAIINNRSMESQDQLICEGTPKEITSKINEYKNGISWSPGGKCRIVSKADNDLHNTTECPPIQNISAQATSQYFKPMMEAFNEPIFQPDPMKKYTITSTEDTSIFWQADYEDLMELAEPGESVEAALDRLGLKKDENLFPERIETAAHGRGPERSADPQLRPSPSISATIFPVGHQMTGNDGNTWEIHEDSRGVHRWVKVRYADGALVDAETWVILTVPDGAPAEFENSVVYFDGDSAKSFSTREEAEAYGRDFGFAENFWAYRVMNMRELDGRGYKISGNKLVKQNQPEIQSADRGLMMSASDEKMQNELERLRKDVNNESITLNEYFEERDKVYKKYGYKAADGLLATEAFGVGDVVYNKAYNTIGIIRDVFDQDEARTDADGVVLISDLEKYDKNNVVHAQAQIAPSTMKEIEPNTGNIQPVADIPNNYAGKTAEEIWAAWDYEQKKHFLIDHLKLYKEDEIRQIADTKFEDLSGDIKNAIEGHRRQGQYDDGGFTPEQNKNNDDSILSAIMNLADWSDWEREAVENIMSIADQCNMKYLGHFNSGGGFEHVMFILPSNQVAVFSNVDDTIFISAASYTGTSAGFETAHNDFWEDPGKHFSLKPNVEIEVNYSNRGQIAEAINSGEFIPIAKPQEELNDGGLSPKIETVSEQFDLSPATTIEDIDDNIKVILSQYFDRRAAAIQVEKYLNENPELAKQFSDERGIRSRVELERYLANIQKAVRAGKGKEHSEALRDARSKDAEYVLSDEGIHVSADDSKAIANTIIDQLGGMSKLIAMTGAYNFVVVNKGVSFRIKNPKANYIKIVLNPHDSYDIEIGRIRGLKYTVVAKSADVPVENMRPFIESETGMYLKLFDDGGLTETDKEKGEELYNKSMRALNEIPNTRTRFGKTYDLIPKIEKLKKSGDTIGALEMSLQIFNDIPNKKVGSTNTYEIASELGDHLRSVKAG